jgi:hypothetical protein
MPIEFVSGDLFENAHGVQAFAHGCNVKLRVTRYANLCA